MHKAEYRHEWKHEINYCDLLTIRHRMRAIAEIDTHALEGRYEIRSLYFDNLSDKALREKLDGVNRREKFRLRYYNGDTGLIHLEKKSKLNGLGTKGSAAVTPDEVQALMNGDCGWMLRSGQPLLEELYSKMHSQGLRPRTIVDYTREPFIFAPGNVRVTLDYNIRASLAVSGFLDPDCVTLPVPGSPIILEVKWDEYLPAIIRDAVQLEGRHTSAFSKYAACRVYG